MKKSNAFLASITILAMTASAFVFSGCSTFNGIADSVKGYIASEIADKIEKIEKDTGLVFIDNATNEITETRDITNEELELVSRKYGYSRLSDIAKDKKASLEALYNKFYVSCKDFHEKDKTDLEGDGVVCSIGYPELGLSIEESASVWTVFVNDNPTFFWISKRISYTTEAINVLADSEYFSGEERQRLAGLIEEEIAELDIKEESPYMIALAIHDYILKNIEYAYRDDGKTPDDSVPSHNIVGFFDRGRGVCETYAKTFALLLDRYGVENAYVTGRVNEGGHAWNTAKMDDGNWYWFDLTWDDSEGEPLGMRYNCFCVGDKDPIFVRLNTVFKRESDTFEEAHIPNPAKVGIDFLYDLPKTAERKGDFEGVTMIGDTFTNEDGVYKLLSYDNAEQTAVLLSVDGVATVKDKTYFCERELTVVSVGDGETPVMLSGNVRKIYIPKTVICISDLAFFGNLFLREIDYEGTHDEWEEIYRGRLWKSEFTKITVNCLGEE